MINVAVSGYCGRMGNRIATLISEEDGMEVTGGLEKEDHPDIGKDIGALIGKSDKGIVLTDDTEKSVKKADILVEFTTPEATISNLEICVKNGVNMLIGTTGLSEEQINEIEKASNNIAVVQSSNMSVGVNLLFEIVKIVAEKIYKEADIEVLEAHHRFKNDAPSGTANTIAEIISGVEDKKLEDIGVYGREGHTGTRSKEEIGIHSLRACDIIGEHNVVFGLEGERLELTHKAHTRDIFVLGALKAVKFLSHNDKGLFDMQDVLKTS